MLSRHLQAAIGEEHMKIGLIVAAAALALFAAQAKAGTIPYGKA
jgi:hypothetical protein